MTYRITEAMLKKRIEQLNKLTNSPLTPYTRTAEGRSVANVGNYHLSHAYGGVCVHRMHNESGGVSTPIISYHTTKRECFDALCAFISGIEFALEELAA
jgi:hypothetical protein